jgi:hypothetical protein
MKKSTNGCVVVAGAAVGITLVGVYRAMGQTRPVVTPGSGQVVSSAPARVALPEERPPLPATDSSVAPYTPFNQPAQVKFDDYFVNKAIRLEFYDAGDATHEMVALQHMFEEPVWPENPRFVIPPFEVGKCAVKMYDAASGRLIYAHGFDTEFVEYRTTSPAINGVNRVFERSVHVPEPKSPARLVFLRRDKSNKLVALLENLLDPKDYHIIKEAPAGDWTFEVHNAGDPHACLDFVYLSEGYTVADKDKFKADVEKMSTFLFSVEPYKSAKDRISIRGVFRPSAERGVDEPRQHSFKNTVMNAAYNTFDLDRYLLVEDDFTMHRMAAQVPYDAVTVLVNSSRYGGGSIALDYNVASVDGPNAERIYVHELGHSFAYLADEYVGDVAYNDMYPQGIEPLEPNITELLDPANIKWKALVSAGMKLPSEPTNDLARVGAFEGAGYLSKGMYRPQVNCWMGNAGRMNGFCAVCTASIKRMIDYYAEAPGAGVQPATQAAARRP